MSSTRPLGPSVTGLFRAAWRPRKSIVILWRRVETIAPDAYAAIVDWAQTQADDALTLHWLGTMATNEVSIDADAALAELDTLLQRQPPAAIREQIQLLRDLIWEASEPGSDWLTWTPCRICGRRWAVIAYEGFPLCPLHSNPAALMRYVDDEGARFPGWPQPDARFAAVPVPAGSEQVPDQAPPTPQRAAAEQPADSSRAHAES